MSSAQPPSASITFSFEIAKRTRVARFVGAITDRELIDAFDRLLHDPAYDASLNDLVDLREVTHMGVTSAGLHRLIALYDERGPAVLNTRNAFVAPTDVLYGVSRMFQTMRGEAPPAEIEVFRTLDEAESWIAGHPDFATSG
jgi:hypothetical protein